MMRGYAMVHVQVCVHVVVADVLLWLLLLFPIVVMDGNVPQWQVV